MELSKASTPSKKANSSSDVVQAVSSSVTGSVKLVMKRKVTWTFYFLRNINESAFHGPVKFSSSHIILTISRSYIKWFVVDNLYIVQVTSWRCFSRILPQLTQFVVNFKISSTVPVSCIPLVYKMIFSPVEQKKLRIRHKLMYVKYRKPSCFEDFTPSVLPSWKAAINKRVKWT